MLEITISEQLRWFAAAVIMGVIMGALYGLLSILYAVMDWSVWTTTIWDILYAGLCGVCSFLFMIVFLDGRVRIYPWAGMALGGLPVVHFTGAARRGIVRRLRLRRRMKQSGVHGETNRRFWVKNRKKHKKMKKNL